MNKIFLVVRREYLSRVRKKSFLVMTLLTPVLVIAFYGVLIYFAINKDIGDTRKVIYVSDESGLFAGKLRNTENMAFTYGRVNPGTENVLLDDDAYYALLLIPPISIDSARGIRLVAKEQASISTLKHIEDLLENEIRNVKLERLGVDQQVVERINRTRVKVKTEKLTASGIESGNSSASTAIGFAGAFIIYMFIFIYGVQVMRGVIEEKTNRIVEVIISSVKPFELMMGKIIGIALVGLTQFLLWVLLVSLLGGSVSGLVLSQADVPAGALNNINTGGVRADSDLGGFMGALMGFNYPFIIGMFLFYFIGGYLFYGALFAAIGSAVDNDTDTQQFMFPITLPLIFALVLAQSAVISNPGSSLSFWLSVIPLTSPVVMMVRLPFDVPMWEILVSMACMIAGFTCTVWLAGRIYRVGILLYGKKPSYREIARWLFYKG